MIAGSLSLSYTAGTNTFSAIVSNPPGFNTVSVTLSSPTGGGYPMTRTGGGTDTSFWNLQMGQPGQGQPAGGCWNATAILQGTATCSGSANV